MGNPNVITGSIVAAIIAVSVVSVFVLLPASDVNFNDNTQLTYDNSNTDAQKQSSAQISTPSYMQASNNNNEEDSTYDNNLSLVEIFENTEPGVVRLNVQRAPQIETNDNGVGSGFVYDTQGHIVTNMHVIQEAENIHVTFLDGSTYKANVIGQDEFTDIAVLKVDVDTSLLHPLALGNSSELKVGEQIAAIGNPFGLSGSMTSGIVSQVGRLLPSSAGYSIPDVIQTDAAINPGNSGGPLLNMRGEVIGINNAIQSTTGEFAGVGFAIPSVTAMMVVPTLIEDSTYAHPWIGISGRDIGPNTAQLMRLDNSFGFLIVDVIEQSPADKAGLHPSKETAVIFGEEILIGGDVILGIDGNEVRKISDILIHLQRSKSVGDEIILDILRDEQMLKVSLILQQRPIQ